jgi:hypothetical protein
LGFAARWGGSIALNIIGGIATVAVVELGRLLHRRRAHRRFRTVLGLGMQHVRLTLGKLVPIGNSVFQLEGVSSYGITAKEIGSFCEIRALSYITRSIAQNSSIETQVVSAQEIATEFNLDFISVGAMSNLKSCDLFSNPGNKLAEYSPNKRAFVRKKDGSVLWCSKAGYDHGIIVKIQPVQFPNRTWITCGGLNEWGTSGSAYFLANHWRELYKRLGGSDKPFLAVIEVEEGKDQSAMLRLFECDDEPRG